MRDYAEPASLLKCRAFIKMKDESRLQDRHKKVEVASKLSSLIFTLSTFLLFTACSEVLYLSVEQMVPPEIMPAKAARSIGVVNNFSRHNVILVNEDAVLIPCDADSVKEQLQRYHIFCQLG